MKAAEKQHGSRALTLGSYVSRMADPARRLPENAPGEFFVDATCIDCDTCRQIAPEVFARSRSELSFVEHQPVGATLSHRAAMALVACPTGSIGGAPKPIARAAAHSFPEPITEDVLYCGYTSADSFGASSYLIVRSAGNVLVDSPRAAGPLVERIARIGGVSRLFLSHADDVADHAAFRRRFGCERILHGADVRGATRSVEYKLSGYDPVRLDHDLLAIPVPGHTRGSTALLYKDEILFTGDHLWFSPDAGGLHASRSVCWYSWAEQIRSMERLLDFRFEWVLPGHGRRYRAKSATAMRSELTRLLRVMRGRGPG
jgi:glyoxylase-like metal-dependent hydrolase (beta-lactamase superfamily II)/ferredoxin